MNKMKTTETEIIENVQISRDFYRLRFFWDKNWGKPKAGNFCEIKVNDLSAPLLRRPFAFSNYCENENYAEIIYQKRGTATQILSQKEAKTQKIEIIAPLGNSFYDDVKISEKKRVFAVAGGVGLGPILFAAKTAPFEATLVAGFRNAGFVPAANVFDGVKAQICTDDGSAGFSGNVVDFLKTTDINADDLLIACGPSPMLRALREFCATQKITCKVSMEEMMACGIGACMGCVVKGVDGHKRVCKEGPVFDVEELAW